VRIVEETRNVSDLDRAAAPERRFERNNEMNSNSNLWKALDSSPEYRAKLKSADVILGDFGNGNESIFFGEERLREIAAGDRTVELRVERVPIDERSEDIEVLCAFCLTQKGRTDYKRCSAG
jgi:hypothetical protein